ncbi:MAG TPA: mannose-1-phosphate guanylyltransferase/mannose-6-phosphate isomerase [Rhodocyclaceae bacterium]|jgi:mannose-1-phosphate guanylyltransferase/mannose-6-phosphate isomerase
MHIQPVILCGGSGTRLWPLSREQYPKQLLKLNGDVTMLQATAQRLQGLPLGSGDHLASPILVGNEEYRFLIAQQLKDIGVKHAPIILEPSGRNTAPALTIAALASLARDKDALLVIMPADHVIQDREAFQESVLAAITLAQQGKLVTFGIEPTGPETGYGYIKLGKAIEGTKGFLVDQFVEKPDLATAEAYLASGNYLWNGGIFVMQAATWLAKIKHYCPEMGAAMQRSFDGSAQDKDFLRPDKEAFESSPSDSIDYAVLEKLADPRGNTGEVVVVPLAAKWSDLGAWNALWEIGEKDQNQNVLMGDVITTDTHNTLVVSQDRLIACVGLDNIVVVDTPDAVLVADKDQMQYVKNIVTSLKAQARTESQSHRKVYRPWGWYDSIDEGPRFQVKRIVVNPGAALSLQMHHHRAEHWIVVSGSAKVTRGDESFLVSENESTYIPIGTKHRLENPGRLPLEMIEVQSGSYLGEDDIVRFEDDYGRVQH